MLLTEPQIPHSPSCMTPVSGFEVFCSTGSPAGLTSLLYSEGVDGRQGYHFSVLSGLLCLFILRQRDCPPLSTRG